MSLSRGGYELSEIWHRQSRFMESDAQERADERNLSGPDAYRRKGTHLRRRGETAEADRHELHALGLETASAHDHETRTMRVRSKAHKTANVAYDAGKGGGEEHKTRRGAHDRYQEAQKEHTRLSNQWHDMAKRVHVAGGNAALAYYKPRLESDENHQSKMAQHIANRNSVSVTHSDTNHDFHSLHGDAPDRHARVTRAAREAHEALGAHHPKSNPEVGRVTRDSLGYTSQRVFKTGGDH